MKLCSLVLSHFPSFTFSPFHPHPPTSPHKYVRRIQSEKKGEGRRAWGRERARERVRERERRAEDGGIMQCAHSPTIMQTILVCVRVRVYVCVRASENVCLRHVGPVHL